MVRKALLALVLICGVALAQDIPNHSVPIGAGPGVFGFKSLGPCAVGQTLIFQGSSTDPVCGVLSTIKLTTGQTFNLSTTGTNTPGCEIAVAGCATQTYLYQRVQQNYDLACNQVIFLVASGTYNSGLIANGELPGNCYFGQVTWRGNVASPTSVVIAPPNGVMPFLFTNGAKSFVEGFTLDGAASSSGAIAGLLTPTALSQVGFSSLIFKCAPGSVDIQPGFQTYVFVYGNYTIDKTGCVNSLHHIQGDPFHGVNYAGAFTVTLLGSPVFDSFVSNNSGIDTMCSINFTANFAGAPFLVYGGGQTYTCAAGPGTATQHPSYFPSSNKTGTFSAGLTAGSTTMTVSAPDATAIAAIIGNQQGLLVVSTAGGLPPGEVIPELASISGTNITLAWPATQTGTRTIEVGGFINQGGHYFGSTSISSIPPMP